MASQRWKHSERENHSEDEVESLLEPESASSITSHGNSRCSSDCRAKLKNLHHRWPLSFGFLIVFLVSWIVEHVSFLISDSPEDDKPSAIVNADPGHRHRPGRQCPNTVMPACLALNHWVLLFGVMAVSITVWLCRVGDPLKSVKNAEHIARSLFWMLALGLAFRYVFRVKEGNTLPSIKGAYVINMRHSITKWERMRDGLLSSFEPEIVHRSLGVEESPTMTAHSNAFGMKVAKKYRITASHIAALEAISKSEDTSLRGLHGRHKHWYLVFEDDALLSPRIMNQNGIFTQSHGESDEVESAATAAAAAAAGGGGGGGDEHNGTSHQDRRHVSSWHGPDVRNVVLQVLRRLPKRAQAVNLGACKGRVSLGAGVKCACSLFGSDSFTLGASVLAKPLDMSVADLIETPPPPDDDDDNKGVGLNTRLGVGVTTNHTLGGGEERVSLRGGRRGLRMKRHLWAPFYSSSKRQGRQKNIANSPSADHRSMLGAKGFPSPSQSTDSFGIYRGFGTCRHAYAVTPAGARWMIEVLLHPILAAEQAEALPTAVDTVTGQAGGTKKAGDSSIARAAVVDYRFHQTYFTRIFTQAEWGPC